MVRNSATPFWDSLPWISWNTQVAPKHGPPPKAAWKGRGALANALFLIEHSPDFRQGQNKSQKRCFTHVSITTFIAIGNICQDDAEQSGYNCMFFFSLGEGKVNRIHCSRHSSSQAS